MHYIYKSVKSERWFYKNQRYSDTGFYTQVIYYCSKGNKKVLINYFNVNFLEDEL